MKFAVGHQARVGKDTFAEIATDYLKNRVEIIRFALPVYHISHDIQERLNKDKTKDPALLQFIGEGLRKIYGETIFVDSAEKKIKECDPQSCIIVTDMRYENEMEMLKRNGFTTVKIVRDNRVIDRDPNHMSEIALQNAKFDIVLENNGTLSEYTDKVIKILNTN